MNPTLAAPWPTEGPEVRPEAAKGPRGTAFYLLAAYLVLEYIRPQSLVHALAPLHLPAIVQALLGAALLFSGHFNLRNRQSQFFVALFALMVIQVPLATNNYWAFWMTYQMMLYLLVWLMLLALAALLGLSAGRVEGSGFLGDENDFCLVMNMGLCLAYFLFFWAQTSKAKVFYLALAGLFIMANLASFSRGGFVGLVAAGGYCWWRSPRKVISAVLIGVAALLAVAVAKPGYWDKIETIETQGASAGTGEERIYLWGCGWRMFLSSPIIGVGPGNFNWCIQDFEPPGGFRGDRSRGGRPAHSLYFTLLPELGLLGVICFGGMIWTSLKDWRRITRVRPAAIRGDPEARRIMGLADGLAGATFAFLVSGAFLSVLYYAHFWMLIAAMVALANSVDRVSLPAAEEAGETAC
jgi:hypothetical protein